jgi:hypothetical protein
VVEAGLATVNPQHVMRLTYEDLVADPQDELGRIARFAGLAESPEWVARLGRLQFPNRNEAWRAKLEPDVRERIESFQAEELRRYKYL